MSLHNRIARLEDRAGGKECPHCSGVLVIRVNGRLHQATKNGVPIRADDVGEGRCPECESEPVVIRVPGLARVSDIGGGR